MNIDELKDKLIEEMNENNKRRLQKQLSTERSILDNAPVWAELANTPLDTVIGIQFGQILGWQNEIESLRRQVATLERVITGTTEVLQREIDQILKHTRKE